MLIEQRTPAPAHIEHLRLHEGARRHKEAGSRQADAYHRVPSGRIMELRGKKKAHLTVAERALALYGDAWSGLPSCRHGAGGRLCRGQTRSRERQRILERSHAVSRGYIPFLISDQLPDYGRALLLCVWHTRGPPTHPRQARAQAHTQTSSHLLTCIMPKSSAQETGAVWSTRPPGSSSAWKKPCRRVAASPASHTINTSFVERNNLTCRRVMAVLRAKCSASLRTSPGNRNSWG